ncbi:TolC family protein [Hymenobacter sp. HSC-4F20]|uniref:TolC family protein n=1 Tax=Hymenobacter sp. HSC-4F20 TaxID=2864135 RepID=UPI001C73CF2C|nr:TolC family protein [Hymenobacter sp. HSC-4F20]MBX0290494.1 TolC family protein [Hymenobacter sp. HSC-4F20]
MKTAHFFPVLVLALAPLLSRGQTPGPPPPPAEAWEERFFKAPEVVLPILYQAAIGHSAGIDKLEAAQQVAGEDIRLARKKILNSLALGSSYNYGTLPYFSTNGSTERVQQLNAFALGARAQYNVGLSLTVPLEQLASRRATVHKQELILQQAVAERAVGEEEIRRQVILLYQELALARANLQHHQSAVQLAGISKKLADSKFRSGELQVDEQMTATELHNKALLAQEEARNKYQTALLLLEDLLGSPLHALMTGR